MGLMGSGTEHTCVCASCLYCWCAYTFVPCDVSSSIALGGGRDCRGSVHRGGLAAGYTWAQGSVRFVKDLAGARHAHGVCGQGNLNPKP